jgi:hypothetical protein
MRVIESSITTLGSKNMEIINPNFPEPIKSVEVVRALITCFKPEIILFDHFLSGSPLDRILGKIRLEDGEGISIVDEILFSYIGEVKPIIISLSTRSKEELGHMYGNSVKHYPEGNMLELARCLKEKCSC